MNDRLSISSAVPADLAERISDKLLDLGALDDAADALEAENERMAKQNAGIWLHDAEFWKEELLDSDLPIHDDMAEAMKHLEAAAMEAAALDLSQCYFIRKVLSALVGVENSAKGRAESQLLDIYGRGE